MEHVVYKWKCKDSNIKDIYVGYSKDFDRRIKWHKRDYNKICKYQLGKKYDFVRENGGWDNWEFLKLASFPTEKDAMDYERMLI